MHELPVINKIMDISLRHGAKHKVTKILEIELKVGALSDLEPEWMQRYFEYISKDTIAAEAILNISIDPVVYKCHGCGKEFEIELSEEEKRCPDCDKTEFKIVSGKGYFINNIKVIQ